MKKVKTFNLTISKMMKNLSKENADLKAKNSALVYEINRLKTKIEDYENERESFLLGFSNQFEGQR